MFQMFKDRAWKALRDKDPEMKSHADLIAKDLERTLISTKQFNYLSEGWKRLRDMLYAISYARPDIGYTQGLNFYAGLLILNCKNVDAFNLLCYLLNIPILSNCMMVDEKYMMIYGNMLEELVNTQLQKLGKYLKSRKYNYLSYIFDGIVALFMKNFPYETELKLVDRIIQDPEIGVFRISLAVFKALESILITQRTEEIMMTVKSPLLYVGEEELLEILDKTVIEHKDYERLREKHIKVLN